MNIKVTVSDLFETMNRLEKELTEDISDIDRIKKETLLNYIKHELLGD